MLKLSEFNHIFLYLNFLETLNQVLPDAIDYDHCSVKCQIDSGFGWLIFNLIMLCNYVSFEGVM